jgi:hypothetical protein
MALVPHAKDPNRQKMMEHKRENPASWQGAGTKEQREKGKRKSKDEK